MPTPSTQRRSATASPRPRSRGWATTPPAGTPRAPWTGRATGSTSERGPRGQGHRGRSALADFVDGLRATDEGDRSHLTVIGHSYGSTTAAHGAEDDGLDADSLTLIGSPGAGGDDVNSVGDLRMPEGKVYAGSADNDFVSWLGRDGDLGMGRDPAQADFGAKVFAVAPGEDFHVETIGQGITNHTSYFDDEQPEPWTTSRGSPRRRARRHRRAHPGRQRPPGLGKDEVVHQVDRGIEEGEEIDEVFAGGRDWVGDQSRTRTCGRDA